jgi:hypothetical protein
MKEHWKIGVLSGGNKKPRTDADHDPGSNVYLHTGSLFSLHEDLVNNTGEEGFLAYGSISSRAFPQRPARLA